MLIFISRLCFLTRLIFRRVGALALLTGLCYGSTLATPAYSIGLEATRVTLHFKNDFLKNVLLKIQEQSAFNFSFSEEIGSIQGVSIRVKDKPLSDVLKALGAQANVSFHPINQMISVVFKAPPPPPPTHTHFNRYRE